MRYSHRTALAFVALVCLLLGAGKVAYVGGKALAAFYLGRGWIRGDDTTNIAIGTILISIAGVICTFAAAVIAAWICALLVVATKWMEWCMFDFLPRKFRNK